MFDLTSFIKQFVIHRDTSMFFDDLCDKQIDLHNSIQGKSFLIIGGAGSIGSSFVKALLHYNPLEIVIVDINENELTELTRFLRSSEDYSTIMPKKFLTYPMDYSSSTFRRMFTRHKRVDGTFGFDVVANFSAHKHVRSEKDIFAIEALMNNNVIRAKALLDLLADYPPESYFCVSTDKAANPVNIMGASKRIMEDLIFSYSDRFPVKTARFANVAFSNGSLPSGFLKRISYHQPLSAPTDVRRYFVSPEESGQICLIAAILGDNRSIFFPKLKEAEMTSFDKIAEDLLKTMNLDIDYCNSDDEAIKKAAKWIPGLPYPVYFAPSSTSGEKQYEEFYTKDEIVDENAFRALGVIKEKSIPDKYRISELIRDLNELFECDNCSKEQIVCCLKDYLPCFEHIETGKNLDEKM